MWKWFEDRTGKWSEYSASNNKTIDDAFVSGESSVRFTASRRRYAVTFANMLQVRALARWYCQCGKICLER